MSLPTREELRAAFMQALQDGMYHSHDEVADFIRHQFSLDQIADQPRGWSYQTWLDNEINWIKGKEFWQDLGLIEYDSKHEKFRATRKGLIVVVANRKTLDYSTVRRLVYDDHENPLFKPKRK